MEGRMGSYVEYTGSDPAFMIAFHYPKGWKLQEERGTIDVYRQVRVLGPRNEEDTYTPYVSVRGSPLKSFGGKHHNVQELINSYKQHLFHDATIESERQRTVAGIRTTDLTASFIIPPQHKPKLKAIPIPVKTRLLFLEKDPYLYELIYSADAREYERHSEAFERLIKTFRFQ